MKAILGTITVLLAVALAAAQPPEKKENTRAQDIVKLTNEYRKANKRQPLKVNALLTKAAQEHADNLAKLDKDPTPDFNPHILDGKTVTDRVTATGYKSRGVGENISIAADNNSVEVVMERWQKSDLHRENLLRDTVTEIGVAATRSKSGRWWYVQVFAKPAG